MKKQLRLLLTITMVLVALSFSCTDHDIPEKIELKTLPIFSNPNQLKCSIVFALNVIKLGELPVKEYGAVYSANFDGHALLTATPTIENNLKVIFDLPVTAGYKQKIGPQLCTNNIYYRAYAILIDDSIVYGDIIHFRVD
ncbi:hypothetical protein L0657_23005 [Dyadobacter sp. CY345]|uniref:hypothetical protein n=1 Tax=Dyadobacter sp. CY345 TaxID=2909335 RepID=UPI001F449EAD|nr:hypothetical protein [Dyadobacter sp. CY345]MCF2446844.1 hypothetical protein [Dyadobacter sp. CY345]